MPRVIYSDFQERKCNKAEVGSNYGKNENCIEAALGPLENSQTIIPIKGLQFYLFIWINKPIFKNINFSAKVNGVYQLLILQCELAKFNI